MYIIFDEVSVKIFGLFLNQISVSLFLTLSILYIIVDLSPLSDVFFKYFFQSVAYLLILLTLSFREQKILNFNQSI